MIDFLSQVGRKGLQFLSPEFAHEITTSAMKAGIHPKASKPDDPRLGVQILGQKFSNPIGMAAGFDKNGLVYNPLHKMGFGFAEVGTVTPQPQVGNKKPRAFRLPEFQAIINRYGFNNEGVEKLKVRLEGAAPIGILGINVGANKTTDDKAADYAACIAALAKYASYITVNISSPNTPGLRALQVGEALDSLLARVV
ncbi:MAG: dihydroorotate dehydrogenase (quinone), partial [Hyphomicrobiales bacterium]